jgi:molybdate transport system regulatory protein
MLARMSESRPDLRPVLRIDFPPAARLGRGKIMLLELIRETGSISAAGRAMDMSYRRAWLLIDGLNELFDTPAVSTTLGGRGGGTAALTPFGVEIVKRYRAMYAAAEHAIARDAAALTRHVRAARRR